MSNSCLIHDHPLKELPELGFRNTLKNVKNILRGKEVELAVALLQVSHKSEEFKLNYTYNPMEEFFFPIKVASCLKITFAAWISNNFTKFRDPDLRSSAWALIQNYLFHNSEIKELSHREHIAALYLLCASLEPELLTDFYSGYVDFIGLELGLRRQGILREVYSKRRDANCDTCAFKFCVMKKLKTTFSICSSELNFKYLLQNSYMLARIAMQGRPIERLGNDAWSPLNLMPSSLSKDKKGEEIEFQLRKLS